MINHLQIEVSESVNSNDHQARILIDGSDWLGPELLGLDPIHLEMQLLKIRKGSLIVGRCRCGGLGCDDAVVEAKVCGDDFIWVRPGGRRLTFNRKQYDSELLRFADDKSWETIGRMVERHVGQIFRETATEDGCTFDWASTRIKDNQVHLSYSRGVEQRLLEFNWDGKTLDSAIDRANQFHRERF